MNASKIFRRALVLSLVLAAAIAVVGGVVAGLVVGQDGVVSVLIGTGLAVVFAGITIVSLLAAIKYDIAVFFGIIMGAWLLKAVLFIVLLALLREAPFVHDWSLFLSIVAAVVGTLVIDAVVVAKGRIGYVSDIVFPWNEPAPEGDQTAADAAKTAPKADDQA